jgi:POT family proton-dependent oligopeptide transporter
MGINLGAFISPLVCGWLAQSDRFRAMLASAGISPEASWHWGFGAAAVGMLLGLVQYMGGWKHLGTAGVAPVPPKDAADRDRQRRRVQVGIGAALALAAVLALLSTTGLVRITPEGVGHAFGVALLVVSVALFAGLLGAKGWTPLERKQLIVIAVLFVGSTIFWAVFEQAGSTLNLFAERNTDLHAFGVAIPASWLQSLEPVFTVVFAPVFAWLWLRLGRRDPSSPAKFSWGLLLVGLGFAILIFAAKLSAAGIKVSPMWLTVTYLLHSFGELCLSPVGLSATTRLAPARVAGLMMGVWFLSLSLGNYLGGQVASLYESLPLPTLFGVVAACAVGAALVLALLVRPIKTMLAPADRAAGEAA